MFKENPSSNSKDTFNLSAREKGDLKFLVEGMSYKMVD